MCSAEARFSVMDSSVCCLGVSRTRLHFAFGERMMPSVGLRSRASAAGCARAMHINSCRILVCWLNELGVASQHSLPVRAQGFAYRIEKRAASRSTTDSCCSWSKVHVHNGIAAMASMSWRRSADRMLIVPFFLLSTSSRRGCASNLRADAHCCEVRSDSTIWRGVCAPGIQGFHLCLMLTMPLC